MRTGTFVSILVLATSCGDTGPVGPRGPAGQNALVRLDEEPPGTNCANGGTSVHVGLDTNGNGLLDDAEITDTQYVCVPAAADPGSQGSSGFNSLVTVADADPANCPAGGKTISVGLDNGDGGGVARDDALQPGEVDKTYSICNGQGGGLSGILEGDYTIQNTLDVALIANVTEITGSLTVTAPGLSTLTLPSLQRAHDILVVGNDVLATLAAPSLEEIVQDVYVGGPAASDGNPALSTVSFPALGSVGRDLYVRYNTALTTLSAPALDSIGRHVSVSCNDMLTVLGGLDAVTTIGGSLSVGTNAALQSFGMVKLATVHDFTVDDNALLTTFDLPALASVTDIFQVFNNPVLPTCAAQNLVNSLSTAPSTSIIQNNNDAGTCP